MPVSNKDIAALIVQFLSSSNSSVSEEYSDSLNVAIDCITEAFEIEREDADNIVAKAFNNEDLITIIKKNSNSTTKSPLNVEETTEESKKAEELKLEGNKAMAVKDFATAIAKYSEAIEILPTNAVYYSNRAAAYSSMKKYEEAIKDAESAIKADPSYSKGYSRLGFSNYALGRYEEALEAYSKVLKIEGDNSTEAMKRDYETAKKKVGESINLEKHKPSVEENSKSQDNTAAGGFPDLSSMLGGGGLGGLGNLLNNPQVMQAAQKMMQDPSAMQQMMNNPAIRQMAEKFSSSGGAPNLGDMMNDPSVRDMASKFFGQNK
ncbi:HCR004Wp [Eremothecium sinecaudum]|uniref:HCR004Wp n=1 Tax=Eremothecium sinecaudum TaxID=45286 RepID=A0A0X8HRL8_9SACH|nr:HCR004Wp [Eremothecium sinecaudum]AMD20154.1 HCR004Wp [Eremothecium sinecaudum]